jgi:uncharacterized protein with LGFP repeats
MAAEDRGRADIRQDVAAYDSSQVAIAGRDIYLSESGKQVLGLLSPHSEAALVAAMQHDDAARLLARSPVPDAARVVEALLSAEDGLAVSLLGSINPGRARELIAAAGVAAAGLEQLPAAAAAIDAHAARMDKILGGASGWLVVAAPSQRDTAGFCRSYANGIICWSAQGGAHAIRGAAARYYTEHGGSGGRLGFPVSPAREAEAPSFGTTGTWQLFEWTTDYGKDTCDRMGAQCGGTLYWSDAYGACRTWGEIGEYYESFGGTRGRLGFPVTDVFEVKGPSRRPSGTRTTGLCQHFEGGTVYCNRTTGPVEVPAHVASYHHDRGYMGGALGFPVSPELDAVSFLGTTGAFQRFEWVEDYPRQNILGHWSAAEGAGGATVYSSHGNGTKSVAGAIGILYEKSGGPNWLGFPRSDEIDARTSADEPWRCYQDFEAGTIFWDEEHGAIAVALDIMELFARRDPLRRELGFPVMAEKALEPPAGERIQIFEHGVVTVRNGTVEVWIEPSEAALPGSTTDSWKVSRGRRPPPRVTIATPAPHQPVAQSMTARGTANLGSHQLSLWLVVGIGEKRYPQARIHQSDDADTDTWALPVRFGRSGADIPVTGSPQ